MCIVLMHGVAYNMCYSTYIYGACTYPTKQYIYGSMLAVGWVGDDMKSGNVDSHSFGQINIAHPKRSENCTVA